MPGGDSVLAERISCEPATPTPPPPPTPSHTAVPSLHASPLLTPRANDTSMARQRRTISAWCRGGLANAGGGGTEIPKGVSLGALPRLLGGK
eukprot:scaffold176911_cov16-Tisochrysis_lutea.AAC.2